MDADELLLPIESPDVAEPVSRAEERGGSGWWPAIAVVALLVALFALIRNDSEPREVEPPVEGPATSTTLPATTSAPVTVPPPAEAVGPSFEPPLLGRVWNSELVILDSDVVTFIDLASGDHRTADLSEAVRPPVAFYEDSIVFSDGRDLVRVTPGFAKHRFVRADARTVVPLPGVPVAFHDADSSQAEVVVVGDNMGATTWLDPGAEPWAMWNGQVLVGREGLIELVPLDGSDPAAIAEGTILAASGEAVLYEACPGGAADDADPTPDLLDPPLVECRAVLLHRDGAVSASFDLPDEMAAVSLAPRGNHVIYVAELAPESGTDVVFVLATDGLTPALSVTVAPEVGDEHWPRPLWAQDGTVAVVEGRDGSVLVDLERGGAIELDQVLGDLQGEVIGFVSIRHEAGINSPAEP